MELPMNYVCIETRSEPPIGRLILNRPERRNALSLAAMEEIARGKLVHVPLADRSLANLKLGVVVPKYRQPAVAAALLIGHLGRALRELVD